MKNERNFERLLPVLLAFTFFASKTLFASQDKPQEISKNYLYKEYEGLSKSEQEKLSEIGNDLRCPTCTGLSVLQSDALFAVQIRKTAIELIKKGQNKKEIIAYFTERYGLWILRAPPLSGRHLWVWILPSLLALFSAIFLWSILLKNRKTYKTRVRSRKNIIDQMSQKLEVLRSDEKQKI